MKCSENAKSVKWDWKKDIMKNSLTFCGATIVKEITMGEKNARKITIQSV